MTNDLIVTVAKDTIALVRAAFDGQGEALNDDRLHAVYAFAKKYDLLHLCSVGLRRLGKNADGELAQLFQKAEIMALFRYERLRYEYERISALFREEQIEYIPLKGTLMRSYYPEPWYRTSCDIDILVRESTLKKAVELLRKKGYTVGERGPHDVSCHSESGVHIELHYCLTHSEADKDPVLSRVFDVATPVDGKPYELAMPIEYFYYHHINHMMRHFSNGGGGIRPYLDLHLFLEKEKLDREKADVLLREGGALRFAKEAESLAELWFGNGVSTEITDMTERFLFLSGGMYSNMKNRTLVGQIKHGGRTRHLMSRIFLPYHDLAATYPSLRKMPFLLPFYQVRRWCKFLFCGGYRRSKKELTFNMTVSEADVAETEKLLKALDMK